MLNIYTSYSCNNCRKEFVLLSEDIDSISKDKYLACPYCGSRKIKKQGACDSLKECMQERSYKRVNRAIRQK